MWKIHFLETGSFALDGGAMFGIIPKPLWSKEILADQENRIPLALRVVLIQGEVQRKAVNLLIDCGIGSKGDGRWNSMFKVDLAHFTLEKELQKRGLSRSDITHVLQTHLHFDHCGGLSMLEKGTGRLMPSFAGATHIIQKEHWTYAHSPTEKDAGSFRKENFEFLNDMKKSLDLIDGEGEYFKGLDLRLVHGHTDFQILASVTGTHVDSGLTGTFVFCADQIPTSSHVKVPWVMAYDNQPRKTIEEKKVILKRALERGEYLVYEHDPRFSFSQVSLDGKHYKPTATHPSLLSSTIQN